MSETKHSKRKQGRKADYGDATPMQVAEAVLKHPPKDASLSRREAPTKPPRRQP